MRLETDEKTTICMTECMRVWSAPFNLSMFALEVAEQTNPFVPLKLGDESNVVF